MSLEASGRVKDLHGFEVLDVVVRADLDKHETCFDSWVNNNKAGPEM